MRKLLSKQSKLVVWKIDFTEAPLPTDLLGEGHLFVNGTLPI